MPNEENIIPHQFKPGQSGNPKGRPKGSSITPRLKRIIEENNGEIADALVKSAIKNALKGDFRFWNAIMERVEGKVADRVQHSGEGGGAIQINLIRDTSPEVEINDGD